VDRASVPSGGSRAKDEARIAVTGDATVSVASRASSASRKNNAHRKAASSNNRVATATDHAKGSGHRGRHVSRSRRNHVPPTHRWPRLRRDSRVRRTQESTAKADAAGATGAAAGAVVANATSRERHGQIVPTDNHAAKARHALPPHAPTPPRQLRTRMPAMYRRGK
jgi:hypothetical protein